MTLHDERSLHEERDAAAALSRLDAIAAFRRPSPALSPEVAGDALLSTLAVLAEAEGFAAPPRSESGDGPLFERLAELSNGGAFRFREVSLLGTWWREEGPAMLAVATDGTPVALHWRRGWFAVEGLTRRERRVDAAVAAELMPRAYAIYARLPDRLPPGSVRRFAMFGIGGDALRLGLAAIAAALTGLIVPVATGAIVGYAAPDGRYGLLVEMLVLLVAASLGGAGFQLIKGIAITRLAARIDWRLQAAVWDRVMRLKPAFFRGRPVGDLAQRVLGIDAIRRILAGEAANGLISGVFSVASLAIMLVYDRTLALYALAYAVLSALLIFALGRAQMRLQRIVYKRKGVTVGLLLEILGGIAKLRVAGAELRALTRWTHAFAEQRINDSRAGRLGAVQTAMLASLPLLGALGAFWIAAGGNHPVAVGDFAAFNSAFGQLTAALLALSASINLSIEAVPLFVRIRPVLEAPVETPIATSTDSGSGRDDPGRLTGSVAVRGLWFRYEPDAPWVLEDIDLDIRPGESVAIVGGSGAGKSTLLRLLLGFETPSRGGVFYDGRDLERLDVGRVRRQIGSVLETSSLIPGSLRENIAGSAPLSREQVERAVGRAGLADDVAAMPMGLESVVMEGGGQLSGGQRQRVMIARALVHEPRLVFLDQATSALDNRTQAIVTSSLAELAVTRIAIAHRLSTIRDADRILVLETGRIVQSGRYDELVAVDGPFRRLVERQMI